MLFKSFTYLIGDYDCLVDLFLIPDTFGNGCLASCQCSSLYYEFHQKSVYRNIPRHYHFLRMNYWNIYKGNKDIISWGNLMTSFICCLPDAYLQNIFKIWIIRISTIQIAMRMRCLPYLHECCRINNFSQQKILLHNEKTKHARP